MQVTWSTVAGLHLESITAQQSITAFNQCPKTASPVLSTSNACDQAAGYFFLAQRESLSLWWEQAMVLFPMIKIVTYLSPIFPIDKPPKRLPNHLI